MAARRRHGGVVVRVSVSPAPARLTLAGIAPTVSGSVSVSPTAASLVLTGRTPTVAVSGAVVVTPTVRALVLTRLTPTVTVSGGRSFYISPSGSDANAGTIGSPWASFNKFLSLPPIAGDTLYCRGGTYTGSANRNQTVTGSGSVGRPITVMAYPGETPVFDGGGNGVNTDRFFILGYPSFNYWTFDGLTLTNFCMNQNGVMTFAGESGQTSGNIIIRNCHITKVGPQTAAPNTSQIIYFGAFVDTALVTNNVIIGPYPTVATDGAAVGTDHGPPSTKNLTITYKVMKNCHKAIQIYGSDGSPNGVTVVARHNTMIACGRNVELVHYMTATIRDNAGNTASESPLYNLSDSGSGTLTADHNFWGQTIGGAPGYQITSGSGIGAASDGGDAGWQGGL